MSEQPPSDPSGNPPPYGQFPGQYPYPVAMEPPATSKATTALVLGITGLVVCPGVLSVPAWIIGQQAVKEIDASQGQLGGRSQAQAGYILGIIGTALAALGILALLGVLLVTLALGATVADEFDDACTTSRTATSFEVDCE